MHCDICGYDSPTYKETLNLSKGEKIVYAFCQTCGEILDEKTVAKKTPAKKLKKMPEINGNPD